MYYRWLCVSFWIIRRSVKQLKIKENKENDFDLILNMIWVNEKKQKNKQTRNRLASSANFNGVKFISDALEISDTPNLEAIVGQTTFVLSKLPLYEYEYVWIWYQSGVKLMLNVPL